MTEPTQQQGRKRKPDEERRSEFFRFRLSRREQRALIVATFRSQQSLTEFIRGAALREAERIEPMATTILTEGIEAAKARYLIR